jgi:hypothetical protein
MEYICQMVSCVCVCMCTDTYIFDIYLYVYFLYLGTGNGYILFGTRNWQIGYDRPTVGEFRVLL